MEIGGLKRSICVGNAKTLVCGRNLGLPKKFVNDPCTTYFTGIGKLQVSVLQLGVAAQEIQRYQRPTSRRL